jgi:hypothetical protein
MNKMNVKRIGIVALVAVFLVAIIAVPSAALASTPAFDEEKTVQVTAYAKGIAIQEIDNETVRMPANLTLTAELIEHGNKLILFKIVGGKAYINGTVYTISEDKSIVFKPRQAVLLRCQGTSSEGTKVVISLYAKYFWMGGHLYVARVRGTLKIGDDTRVLLLMRGYARIP